MADWISAAAVPIVLGVLTFIAAYLTYLVNRRSSDRHYITDLEERLDKRDRRIIRLFNFALRLQGKINSGGIGPAEELPDDLFDKE